MKRPGPVRPSPGAQSFVSQGPRGCGLEGNNGNKLAATPGPVDPAGRRVGESIHGMQVRAVFIDLGQAQQGEVDDDHV
jgi:hypothetical protein